MKLSNSTIYYSAMLLTETLQKIDQKFPIRINFYLQQNVNTLMTASREIEQAKMSIAAQYGKLNESQTGYDIPPENVEIANRELNDLFNLEQDLPIHIFKLSDFDGIELTYQQMSAIMFMIEE